MLFTTLSLVPSVETVSSEVTPLVFRHTLTAATLPLTIGTFVVNCNTMETLFQSFNRFLVRVTRVD